MDTLYREHLLDHYKNPRNKGRLKKKSSTAHDSNPLCGDDITMEILIKDNKVEDIRFDGYGCAISQAAASMVTETLKGKPVDDALKFGREDMLELLHTKLNAVRIKCAMLPVKVLKMALVDNASRSK